MPDIVERLDIAIGLVAPAALIVSLLMSASNAHSLRIRPAAYDIAYGLALSAALLAVPAVVLDIVTGDGVYAVLGHLVAVPGAAVALFIAVRLRAAALAIFGA